MLVPDEKNSSGKGNTSIKTGAEWGSLVRGHSGSKSKGSMRGRTF
jgi:hypothetical protein